jgi:hypothetical protein
VFDVAFLHRSALRSFSNQWVDWSAKWNGIFGSEWRRLCRGSDVEGSQQPEVQVDGSSGAPLPVSLNAAVSASSGACPAQPTVRELPVPALRLVAPLGGMRGSSGRSASPAPALGADRAGIG